MAETNENPAEQNAAAEQPVSPGQSEITSDAKNMAMLCHLLAIFTGFLGPLIIWLIKKDDTPFVDDQGKEAVNFQISMTIYAAISMALFALCIGPFLLAAVAITDIVLLIIAAIKANEGKYYRYPLTIRIIK